MTRITSSMVARNTLADLNAAATRLQRTQQQLTSGKAVGRPSDDPLAAGQAMDLRRELAATIQQQRAADDAAGWLQISDTTLARFTDSASRARELVLRGSNGASSPADREAAAAEIDQLIESVKGDAGAVYAGRRLFSGTATETAPYAAGADDAYRGDTAPVVRTIGPGVSVAISANAGDVLGGGVAAADGKLLQTLREAAAHLRSGTPADLAALATTDVAALDRNLEAVGAARTGLGAVASRVESARSRLLDLEGATAARLSATEDIDVPAALIQATSQKAVYESALRVGASIVQASLLDFLR